MQEITAENYIFINQYVSFFQKVQKITAYVKCKYRERHDLLLLWKMLQNAKENGPDHDKIQRAHFCSEIDTTLVNFAHFY